MKILYTQMLVLLASAVYGQGIGRQVKSAIMKQFSRLTLSATALFVVCSAIKQSP
jgi:putative copper export protein